MIKVLIVDDSAFMRTALSNMLSSDPRIKVIGTARDGVEAVEKVQSLKPDIVTLDVEMPRMDGLEALRRIMAVHPVPVLMVSSITTEGAQVTLDALDLGAVDFIPKNLSELSFDILKIKEDLIAKIKYIATRGMAAGLPRPRRAPAEVIAMPGRTTGERRVGVLAIGTSTGGPKALQDIIPRLPRDFPVPVLIAQHMPPSFTGPFAERLNNLSQITVKEADEGEPVVPGVALLAPGRGHMRVVKKSVLETVASISEKERGFIYRPSVDALMLSAARCYPGRTLGVILTGMGNDGLMGVIEVKRSGGRVFAQDEETSAVYGMPKAVIDARLADKVLSIEKMAGEIINAV
ncbi:MAG: chemotaxis response regulator protein-glutamate methylesterase [Thermodesulfovibrionales bacterium]